MVARLVDQEGNNELYSVVRKRFTNIVGKSGGVLRAFCTHDTPNLAGTSDRPKLENINHQPTKHSKNFGFMVLF